MQTAATSFARRSVNTAISRSISTRFPSQYSASVIKPNARVTSASQFNPHKYSLSFQKQFLSTDAAAAADATPAPVIERLTQAQEGFTSRALRPKATAKYKNLPIGPRKLEYLCRLVRGMNVREAIIQLRLSSKRKSYFLRKGLRTLANTAMNTFNMNRDRLYISEISCTHGEHMRRVEFRARGRAAIRMKRRSHLFLTLAEQPYHRGEIRIGRYGRTIESWQKFDKLSEAWKLKRAEEQM